MQIGIRARVIVLALISALPLPLALSIFLSAEQTKRDAVEKAQHDALILGRSLAAGLNDVFDNARFLLAGFSTGLVDVNKALTDVGCEQRLQRLLLFP